MHMIKIQPPTSGVEDARRGNLFKRRELDILTWGKCGINATFSHLWDNCGCACKVWRGVIFVVDREYHPLLIHPYPLSHSLLLFLLLPLFLFFFSSYFFFSSSSSSLSSCSSTYPSTVLLPHKAVSQELRPPLRGKIIHLIDLITFNFPGDCLDKHGRNVCLTGGCPPEDIYVIKENSSRVTSDNLRICLCVGRKKRKRKRKNRRVRQIKSQFLRERYAILYL